MSDNVVSLLAVIDRDVDERRLPLGICALVVLSISAMSYWLGYSILEMLLGAR